MKALILPVLLLFMLCSSCGAEDALMDERKDFDSFWSFQDTAVFSFENRTQNQLCDIAMMFRTTIDYPYSNMFIFMKTEHPDGKVNEDTLQFILADDKGKWLGNRIGNTVEYEVPVSKGVQFAKEGTYTFRFVHGMQDKDLPEILDFGMRITEHSKDQ